MKCGLLPNACLHCFATHNYTAYIDTSGTSEDDHLTVYLCRQNISGCEQLTCIPMGCSFCPLAQQTNASQGRPIFEVSRSHTHWHTTVSRTPLDEGWVHHRNLYLTAHNTNKRQTSHAFGGIRTNNPCKRSALDPRLTLLGHWGWQVLLVA